MNVIWKYPLEVCGRQIVMLPEGAEFLCVQVQGSSPFLWAKVNPRAETEIRLIRMYATGEPFDFGEARYLGTVQITGFVWHYYEPIKGGTNGNA